MTTRVEIESKLVNAAKRAGGHSTKKEAVNAALQEYVQRRGQLQILELRGKIDYYPDYDHKRLRRKKRL